MSSSRRLACATAQLSPFCRVIWMMSSTVNWLAFIAGILLLLKWFADLNYVAIRVIETKDVLPPSLPFDGIDQSDLLFETLECILQCVRFKIDQDIVPPLWLVGSGGSLRFPDSGRQFPRLVNGKMIFE